MYVLDIRRIPIKQSFKRQMQGEDKDTQKYPKQYKQLSFFVSLCSGWYRARRLCFFLS